MCQTKKTNPMPDPEFLHGITGGAPGSVNPLRGPRGYSAYEIAVQNGFVGTEQEWLAQLGTSGGPISAENVSYNLTETVKDVLDQLLYTEPEVTAISTGLPVQLRGASVASVDLTWVWNKGITIQSLNGGAIDPELRAQTVAGPFTANTNFTIAGNDGTTTASRQVTLSFANERFVGVGAPGLNAAAVAALTAAPRPPVETRTGTHTVTAGPGQKIYYAFAKRLGLPTFTVGGFAGGFDVREEELTNAAGFAEDFYICESELENLGLTTFNVS